MQIFPPLGAPTDLKSVVKKRPNLFRLCGFEIRSKQDCKFFFTHPGEADCKSAIPKMVEHSYLCRKIQLQKKRYGQADL